MKRSRQSLSKPRRPLIAVLACLLSALAAEPLRAERSPLDIERERFLQEARFVSVESIPIGVANTRRATLSDGSSTHDAHVQTIDVTYQKFKTRKGTLINFRDHYAFNVAAYRLDRLLNMNMVPVSVVRRLPRDKAVHRDIRGDHASVTWWVDDVLMMDSERYESGAKAPDPAAWNDQMYQVRVFNQLVFNTDPNLTNLLITTEWRLWTIDFTRAFRPNRQLENAALVQRIDRRLYRGLQALSLEALERETSRHLTRAERKGVMARRDAILEVLADRIAARGEATVICDQPGH